jgi:hypothetical protein
VQGLKSLLTGLSVCSVCSHDQRTLGFKEHDPSFCVFYQPHITGVFMGMCGCMYVCSQWLKPQYDDRNRLPFHVV